MGEPRPHTTNEPSPLQPPPRRSRGGGNLPFRGHELSPLPHSPTRRSREQREPRAGAQARGRLPPLVVPPHPHRLTGESRYPEGRGISTNATVDAPAHPTPPQTRSQNPFALSQSKGLPHFVIPAEAGIQRCERAGRLHPQPPPTPPSSFPQQREPRAGARQGGVPVSRRALSLLTPPLF